MAKRLMTVSEDEVNGWEVEKRPGITQKAGAGTFASEIFVLSVEYFMSSVLCLSYFAL